MAARRHIRTALLVALLSITANLTPVASASGNTDASAHCRPRLVPVSAVPGGPRNLRVAGELCVPAGPTSNTVQILVHGVTYDRTYWDFDAVDGVTNSYVRAATAAGFATFAVDRIGSGDSSIPPAIEMNTSASAFQMKQVIEALRAGQIGPRFAKVAYVGWSLGTQIGWSVAKYGEVDTFVLSGFLHNLNVSFLPRFPQVLVPATSDPRLRRKYGPDPLYLTTAPRRRAALFYDTSNADPAVIDADERTKSAYSLGEIAPPQGILDVYNNASAAVDRPTMVAVGQHDAIFCGLGGTNCETPATVLAHERVFYPNVPQLETYVLTNSGHAMNLHRNARDWFTAAQDFIARTVRDGRR